jgi:hypothetical protein
MKPKKQNKEQNDFATNMSRTELDIYLKKIKRK